MHVMDNRIQQESKESSPSACVIIGLDRHDMLNCVTVCACIYVPPHYIPQKEVFLILHYYNIMIHVQCSILNMADRLEQGRIHNGRVNFDMLKLSPQKKEARRQLRRHTKAVIKTYQEENSQRVTQFYIGKSSVPFSKSMKFDIDNPNDTWTLKRIRSRWSEHRKKYTTMVVLAVIMDDTLPKELEECKTQKYCLYLERSLIDRFKYGLFDKRIANDTSDAGKEANDHDTIAYVLYIVMKLEHPPLESFSGSSSSRRKNCGECSGCRAAYCGVCEHCVDMPRFGGPGRKKQRCKKRACIESLSESSQQQSRESLISTNTYHNDTLESAPASKCAPGSDPDADSETAIDKSTVHVDRELHHVQGNPTSSKVQEQKCVLATSSSENSHSGRSTVYENIGGDRKVKTLQSSQHAQRNPKSTTTCKHERKFTSKSSSTAHKAHENGHDSGGRGIGIDEHSMLVDRSDKKRRHQYKPLLISTEGTSMSRNSDAITRSATTSRFTPLGGHGRSSEVISNSHTMCEDGQDDKWRGHKPSKSLLRNSRPISNKHEKAYSLKPESVSRKIQPPENDASMIVDDGSYCSVKCKKHTERHQHTHSRKDNEQAGMQNVDIEGKVEAHAIPRNAGRKRSPSSVGMQFLTLHLKKERLIQNLLAQWWHHLTLKEQRRQYLEINKHLIVWIDRDQI